METLDLIQMVTLTKFHMRHRCRSRQILGSTRDFFLKNIWATFCVIIFSQQRSWKQTFLRLASKKKVFSHTSGAIFSNQTTLGAVFARIFRDFVKVFTDIAKISTFFRILTNFAQIFDRSKFLEVHLHPLHSHLLHHWHEMSSHRFLGITSPLQLIMR